MAFRSALTLLIACLAISPAHASNDNWFISLGSGHIQHDADLRTDTGSINLLIDPAEDGTPVQVEIGYRFTPNWFVAAEYTFADLDETEIENLAASINYGWFLGEKVQMYVGLVGGASTLQWQEDPIFATTIENENDESYMGGQLGFKAQLSDRWFFQGKYQFLDIDHTTLLRPQGASGEFRQRDYHVVTFGLEVRF